MFDVYARRRLTALLMAAVVGLLGFHFVAPGEGAQPSTPYAVKDGDTLWAIASAHYHGDPRRAVSVIQRTNHLASAELQPGMVLLLPRHV